MPNANPSLTTKGSTIKAAIKAVSKALPRNSPYPAYNLVAMRIDPLVGCYLHATNGQQSIVAGIASTTESAPTTILLNDACLKCLETARDEEDMTISVAKNASKKRETIDDGLPTQLGVEYFLDAVSITMERSRYRFDVRSYEVPMPHMASWDQFVEFERHVFDDMARLVGGIANETEIASNMTGVRLSSSSTPGWITAAATDGKRVAVGEFPAACSIDLSSLELVVPRATLKIARSVEGDENVAISLSSNSCFVKIGEIVIEGLLAAGKFPSIHRLLSRMLADGTHVGTIAREDLVYGLKMAAITTNRSLDCVGVRMRKSDDGIRFSSESPDRGKSCIMTIAGLQHDFDLAVDPTLLLPVLAAIPDKTVDVRVLGDSSLQIGTPNFLFIVAAIQK